MKKKNSNALLMVFMKNPIAGKVKTRLAAKVGNNEALNIYKRLIEHTHFVTSKTTIYDKAIYYSSSVDEHDQWDTDSYSKYLQKGNGLGEKLSNAFSDAFINGYKKVIAIGTDSFEITSDIIDNAFRSLEDSDIVIGPAKDGGYYLIGMNEHKAELFKDIEWGTDTVLSNTLSIIKDMACKHLLLKELSDIDTLEDYENHKITQNVS
ncbi:MAG TPA: glycosyltransferase [Bacteroidetes bacterium]|nr:glycosyltransferase [Bacteroidota bacterium]